MGNQIKYSDYNRMSDVIYSVGRQLLLKMNVTLSYISTTDKRKVEFHREVENANGIKMNRHFQYFMSIEKLGDDYTSVMFRPQDMFHVLDKFKEAAEWFKRTEERLYIVKKHNLVLLKGVVEPVLIKGLADNRYIVIEPIVYQFDEASPQSPGVRITLGPSNAFVDLDVDMFYGLYYSVQSVSLFQCAQNMVNYLGRPEFGHNLMNLNERPGGGYSGVYSAPQRSTISGGINRTIGSNKNRSIFDD